MGMYLETTISLGIRDFIRTCEQLGIESPKVDEENYRAMIDEELYKKYKETVQKITDRFKLGAKASETEVRFLLAWQVIANARLDWLIKYEEDHKWEDLYFD